MRIKKRWMIDERRWRVGRWMRVGRRMRALVDIATLRNL
jgi:hypothetical protein